MVLTCTNTRLMGLVREIDRNDSIRRNGQAENREDSTRSDESYTRTALCLD